MMCHTPAAFWSVCLSSPFGLSGPLVSLVYLACLVQNYCWILALWPSGRAIDDGQQRARIGTIDWREGKIRPNRLNRRGGPDRQKTLSLNDGGKNFPTLKISHGDIDRSLLFRIVLFSLWRSESLRVVVPTVFATPFAPLVDPGEAHLPVNRKDLRNEVNVRQSRHGNLLRPRKVTFYPVSPW